MNRRIRRSSPAALLEKRAEEVERVLYSALQYLSDGEAIPLHWAIENAEVFSQAWAQSPDPGLLLRIAVRAMPRAEVVMAACAIARAALPFAKNDPHLYQMAARVLDAVDYYARRGIIDDVEESGFDAENAANESNDADAQCAAMAARNCAYMALYSADEQITAIDACIRAANHTHGDLSLPVLANVVRAQLAHRDILADIVNANRGAS